MPQLGKLIKQTLLANSAIRKSGRCVLEELAEAGKLTYLFGGDRRDRVARIARGCDLTLERQIRNSDSC